MDKNILNSGDLTTLKLGQTLLTKFRRVANGFISIELAEVKEGTNGVSAAFVFNKSNDKFSRNRARRAWQNGNVEDLQDALNVVLDDSAPWTVNEAGNEVLEVNILNPIASFEGEEFPMRVQIIESIEADDYRASRVETMAKRKGKDGEYILNDGEYIFTYASIVFTAPADLYLTADASVTEAKPQAEEKVLVNTTTGEIFS